MKSKIILYLTFVVILFPYISLAAVNLPWSTGYNCPEWRQSDGLNPPAIDCDGVTGHGGWTTSNGKEEQITSAANYSGGAGGKGQRHWLGDGVNNLSGGLDLDFASPQSEIWMRWYMRYEQGFQWNTLVNQKIIYFDPIGVSRLIIGYVGSDGVRFYSYASGQGYPDPPAAVGWNSVMKNGGTDANGNKTSDGQWHMWEAHIKMDTNGSNGIVELWIDGKKIISVTNANLGTTLLYQVLIGSNGFTPNNGLDMYVDYDDIAISTTGPIGGNTPPPSSGGNPPPNNSGSDASASGGSGCGFVKEDGKGQGAKGEGVSMMILLFLLLILFIKKKANHLLRAMVLKNTKGGFAKTTLFFITTAFIFLLFMGISHAATYYVSPTGTAQWSACTNISTPCTAKTAMENAIAGDIVYFRGGAYNPIDAPVQQWLDTPVQFRYQLPVWNPKNSGTEGNPITFMAYAGETPEILDAPDSAVLGAYRRDYIVLDGFRATLIDEDPLNNDTHLVSQLIRFDESLHSVIRNCDFKGTKFGRHTNNSLITIQRSHYMLIEGNKLHDNNGMLSTDTGFKEQAVNTNAIINFWSSDIAIRNNDIYNNYIGIWDKGSERNNQYYHNHIWGGSDYYTSCKQGIYMRATLNVQGPATGVRAYQNVIRNCGVGVQIEDVSYHDFPEVRVYNNTIVGDDSYHNNAGIFVADNARYAEIFNNIIVGYPVQVRYYTGASTIVSYSNYNDFYSSSAIKRWAINWSNDYSTIDLWRTATNFDINSIESNPQFINPGGANPTDYKLQPNSPARIGRGGSYATVMGAYITGNETIGYDPDAPRVEITSPANSILTTTNTSITISGTATDTLGIVSVTWRNDRGGSGTAWSGTATQTVNWTVSNIALQSGQNIITVTATDGDNKTGIDAITVTVSSGSGDTGGSGSESSASGGSGCGFVKEDGKGQKAKGEGLSLMILLIISIVGISIIRRIGRIAGAETGGIKIYKIRFNFILAITAIALLLICTHSFAANYTLEIIQPRAGLNTTNRFYKAYPALEYNVRVAVIGGAYPFTYSLTTAPSGMTINPSTGEITWPNPTTINSPHSVSVSVTDQESSTASVSWTITVTTSGFRFIDAVNGQTVANGGTGTISNPWKTIADMYEGNDYAAKYKTSYANEFLYFRNGTYFLDAYLEDQYPQMPLVSYNKPLVWLNYPGETPVLDLGNGKIGVYAGGNNLYVQGFTITNMTNPSRKGWQVDSDANNVTFRKNIFHNLTTWNTSNNQSAIMIAIGSGWGNYYSIQDNIFYDIHHGYGITGYQFNNVLVENNIFYDFSDGAHAIGPKYTTSRWFIRANSLYNIAGEDGIWIGLNDLAGPNQDIEISYNSVRNTGGYAFNMYNYIPATTPGRIYVYRNTFYGNVAFFSVSSQLGPFYVYNNVIINNSNSNSHIDCYYCSDSSRVIITNNLVGYPSDNIIDSNNNLTSAYSSYLGTHGYQLDATAPTAEITIPTKENTYSTTASSINLSGSANDPGGTNIGITSVAWSNDRGVNGNCIGATSWACNNISLQSGQNIITVKATDGDGKVATDMLVVTVTTSGGGDTGGNTPPSSSGAGDSSASGGSGCGFVKDDGKGQGAKDEGMALIIMLVITLATIAIARRVFKMKTSTAKTRGKLLNFKSGLIGLIVLFLFAAYTPAHATVYFYYDAENCTDGSYLPSPPWNPYTAGNSQRGTCIIDTTAPQGNKIVSFWWDPQGKNLGQGSMLNEIPLNTIPLAPYSTYYFAFFFRFDRINGVDIWPEGAPDTESFDKAAEFRGNGVRWIICLGERGKGNQDHHFSVFVANLLGLNPEIEKWDSYFQNYNGYNYRYNAIQLEYEKWHSVVFSMKWATDNTGEIGLWMNGIKVLEYKNIKTVLSPGTFERLGWNGTIAQPAYNAPAHYRKFDAIIFTDNWQDIVNGGYLSGGGSDNTPPPSGGNPPSNNSGNDASASGGSGCGFVKDDSKRQRAKGEGLALMMLLIIILSFFLLAERYKLMVSFIKKCNHWRNYDKDANSNDRRADKEIKENSF